MKRLILNPRMALYTEDLTDSETIAGTRRLVDEISQGRAIKTPIYVIRFPEFKSRPAIFNGNRRTKAAELCGICIQALEIQTPGDFQLAQAQQPTTWHSLDEQEFLKFNGEYFYNDVVELRQRGLLCSAYHRARRRIRDTVKKFYSWL